MAFPVIFYKSVLKNTGALLTASSTDTGYTIEDVRNWKAFNTWRSLVLTSPITIDIDLGASGSADADFMALVNHNGVANGATYKLYADTTTPPTNVVQAAYSPTSDDVEIKTFTAPGAKRYWRLEIAKASPPFPAKPFIGELLIGLKMTLPEYLSPDLDPFLKQVAAEGLRAQKGHHLGVVLKGQLHRGELAFGAAGMARTFLTSDLNAFYNNHAFKRLPFGFVLDSDDGDFLRPLWLKIPDDAELPRRPAGSVYSRIGIRIPVEEAWREAA